jgi:glycosyltransferase involved in cell wall biosynthesis
MRIVIDLQGAQGASRHRGIGRYALSLALAMVRNRGRHEVIIALNGLLPDTIEPIRAAFDGLLPQENVRVWGATGPTTLLNPANAWRRHAAELLREKFLADLQPDVVHVTSLFEGYGDDAVNSIGLSPLRIPTAVTLYDLIPLLHRGHYLDPNPVYEAFYMEKLGYLRQADLLLAISASSRREAIDNLNMASSRVINISSAADPFFQRMNISENDKNALLRRFGLSLPFLMYSGATDERKNHLRLIKAFSLLPPAIRQTYRLAVVGGMPTEHREKFNAYIKSLGPKAGNVVLTGHVNDEELAELYNLCALFVFPSWHEGFGLPALEAMACGAPTIGADATSVPEVIGREDALFDPFDEKSIAEKITEVLTDEYFRADLARHGLEQAKKFTWDNCANLAIAAIERWHEAEVPATSGVEKRQPAVDSTAWLIGAIADLSDPPSDERDWLDVAKNVAQNLPRPTGRQLLLDISALVNRDERTGIQRVVRSVLASLCGNPPQGCKVLPVYALQDEIGYRHARQFAGQFLGRKASPVEDDPVDVRAGDIFLGLDFQPEIVVQHEGLYADWRRIGANVYFIVYDLLPVLMPEVFPTGMSAGHEDWLEVVAKTDGALCISRTVADELETWLTVSTPERLRPFKIGWFHLGADFSGSIPTSGFPPDAGRVLKALSSRPTFLMVGTLEPRKGHKQTLAAFELLWRQGIDAALAIVGKEGWMVDDLAEMLRKHPRRNRNLFWLEAISDEYLERVYAAATCLIAASEGEGYGLPLIEAAQHRLPVIARDLPVFREVAGDHAFYFSGDTREQLADALRDWMKLDAAKQAPSSDGLLWMTWEQSTQKLLQVIMAGRWYKQWTPGDGENEGGGISLLH